MKTIKTILGSIMEGILIATGCIITIVTLAKLSLIFILWFANWLLSPLP